MAQQDLRLMSEITKAAVAAAKKGGVKLGPDVAEVLAPKYQKKAQQRAEYPPPHITEIQHEDLSVAKLADSLSTQTMSTPRGGNGAILRWGTR